MIGYAKQINPIRRTSHMPLTNDKHVRTVTDVVIMLHPSVVPNHDCMQTSRVCYNMNVDGTAASSLVVATSGSGDYTGWDMSILCPRSGEGNAGGSCSVTCDGSGNMHVDAYRVVPSREACSVCRPHASTRSSG